jgi:glycosyltransferase involved in cell wall biosynthesis
MVKLSVVIPVYNERQFVAEVLRRVHNVQLEGVDKEIIIVDDCSTDGTREELKQMRWHSIRYVIDAISVTLLSHILICYI